ncbi:MAG TPA: indole-3-glycerol phosphate synthase TrpC [Bryobacteraceae bacterium]|nr:indole-3-glycerol phosphate synthase TrpC [Bryobacteraceae bacterium]
MTSAVPDILARIVQHKKAELENVTTPMSELEGRAFASIQSRRDFAAALRAKKPAIIGEIKKASPSKGLLTSDFRPAANAIEYEAGGAAALSILTDQQFFQGSLNDLQMARSAVAIPALRKDFTISEYHVIEAAANGADAILLIAAILTTDEMRCYRELATRFRMAALVEVHDDAELDSALDSGAQIIGVNNRNLHTFEVRLETSFHLARRIPADLIKVSESGIENRSQIDQLRDAGFDAFLIGEHLMRSESPRESLLSLTA